MQAMCGPRLGARLGGCFVALALLVTALALAPAGADAVEPPEQKTYLAAGDSISFGITLQKYNENFPTEPPSIFEENLVNQALKFLQKKTELGKGIKAVNYSCPGETSNGFIGENEALGGQASTSNDKRETDYHPCSYESQKGFPLYASLGNRSQLEVLLDYLNEGNPVHPVKLITIDIGSNDERAMIAECEGPGGPTTGCMYPIATTRTLPHILHNLESILKAINSTDPGGGHYTGAIVLIGFYNPYAAMLPGSNWLQAHLNHLVEAGIVPKFPNVTYANPFPKFNPGSEESLRAKKAIETYTEMCNPTVQSPLTGRDPGCEGDVHPSLAGQELLGKLVNKAYLANPAK
jgi:lysophospholipase L1-like esterase